MTSISRRRFLQSGAACAAAAALPQRIWGYSLPWPPGIELYTVKDALAKDLTGTLKQLSAMGYKVAESYHFEGFSAKPVRAALDEAGLRCPAAHVSLNGPEPDSAFEETHILGAHYAISSTLRPGHSHGGGGRGNPPRKRIGRRHRL